MKSSRRIIVVSLGPTIDYVLQADDLRLGEHVVAKPLRRQPAGKAVNVARSLAVLGRASAVVGFLGQGEVEWFTHTLAQESAAPIASQWVPIAAPTRMSITLLDRHSGTDTHIREPGFTVTAAAQQRLHDLLLPMGGSDAVVAIAGSPPPGMSAEDLQRLIAAVGATGATIAVDVSGAPLEAVLRRPGQGIGLVKPNREEWRTATGRDLDPAGGDAELHQTLAAVAPAVPWKVVTWGAPGAILHHGRGCWRGQVPVARERVIDTVGCGDALLAGLLDGWLCDDADPGRVLRRGLAAATANALCAGAANFTAAQVAEMEPLAVIRPLAS